MISRLNRVTIPVASDMMEATKRFYEGVFSYKLDRQVEDSSPAQAALLGMNGAVHTRLTIYRSGDKDFGMIGLLEYLKPQVKSPRFERPKGLPFPLFIVYLCTNSHGLQNKAKAQGIRILSDPEVMQIRGSDIAVQRMLDPNGLFSELAEYGKEAVDATPGTGPVRRATIPVAKGGMQASLDFYQEILGMKLYTDGGPSGKGGGYMSDQDYRLRLVVMQQGDSTDGNIGLMEWQEPAMDMRPFVKTADNVYPYILRFLTDDLDGVYARIQRRGSPVVCPPIEHDEPGIDRQRVMACLDPNGVLVHISQSLGG